MFNVTGTEIIILLLVALIVLGPEKLPDAVRRFGRTYGELKRMSQGFQSELRDALEEPSRELRSTVQVAKDMVQGPVQEVRSTAQDMKDLAQGKPGSATRPAGVKDAAKTPPAAPAPAPAPDTAEEPGAADTAGADLDAIPDELWDGEPGE